MDQTQKLTTEYFHAHDVLDMLGELSKAVSLAEVKNLVLSHFGENARFGSCSMSGMDSDAIIQFLLERQKLAEVEPGKFQLNFGQGCGHS